VTAKRPSLSNPWILLATGFGSGYLPKAPGTWGSAVATILAWPIMALGGVTGLALAALLITAVGFKATAVYQSRSGIKDPGPVVVDEFSGQWIALLACPLNPVWFLAGFVAFRLFDITKPSPARQIDRNMGGAAGVMLDDVVAGLYAAGVILAARLALSGL
jgi:phosphatidylglycerophosphatase A